MPLSAAALKYPHRDIVVLGASAGGLEALRTIAAGLSPNLPASIFIVLHSDPDFDSQLPELLNQSGAVPASHAVHGERFQSGHIYVAPNDNHMTLHRDFIRVVRGPRENGHRPAVDPLFRTAARSFGRRVVGGVLSGSLSCGTDGLLAIKSRGGVAIVQSDPEFIGMPASAEAHVDIDHRLPAVEIAPLLTRLVYEPIDLQEPEAPPGRGRESAAGIVCPICMGAMTQSVEGGFLRFRCHVGHQFGVDSLLVEQGEALESALWASVRALEESATLAERLARSSERKLARRFRDKGEALRQHAALIQDVLLHGTTLERDDALQLAPPLDPAPASDE
jgi:two-component system chemotaxis response regulator CheB